LHGFFGIKVKKIAALLSAVASNFGQQAIRKVVAPYQKAGICLPIAVPLLILTALTPSTD
jgi:hypothetical protein